MLPSCTPSDFVADVDFDGFVDFFPEPGFSPRCNPGCTSQNPARMHVWRPHATPVLPSCTPAGFVADVDFEDFAE